MLGFALLTWLLYDGKAPAQEGSRLYKIHVDPTGRQRVSVSFWNQVKATTMLGTTVAILAIDFPSIFERAHAKSEEYGISVMDSGVALITLNAGLSSRKARPWFYHTNRQSVWAELWETVKSSVLPLVIGFIRIVLLSSLDY